MVASQVIQREKNYEKIAQNKGGTVSSDRDLADAVWEDRPGLPKDPAFLLEERWTGESRSSKLKRIRAKMKEMGADIHLLSSLDDIAWLLNMRGNDIAYCPLVLSYALISENHLNLFADPDKFSADICEAFLRDGVRIQPYDEIRNAVRAIPENASVLVDPERISYTLYQDIPRDVSDH